MAEKKTQEQIVKEATERIKKEKIEKIKSNPNLSDTDREKMIKEEEARGASKVTPPKEEKTKDELEQEAKAQKEQKAKETKEREETQAKEDKRILETQDDKLNEDEKKRKIELKDDLKQDKINKRIGEFKKELELVKKSKEADSEANKEKIAELEAQIKELKPSPEVSEKEELKKVETDRLNKYLEEDKDKPREDRREITKEDLDDWYAEDMPAAQDWQSNRNIRRNEDRKRDSYGTALGKKQKESFEKTIKDNPKFDIRIATRKMAEMKKEGKSNEEISDTIAEEYPECAMIFAVTDKMPELTRKPNGPELIIAEAKKRMEAKPPKKKEEETDEKKKKEEEETTRKKKELDDAVEAEIERREAADEAAGIASSRARDKKTEEPKSDLITEMERLGKKVGMTKEQLKKARDRRKAQVR